jgi:predicted ArsR family transcriptional regulator
MTPAQVRKMGGKTRWRIVEALKLGGGACVRDLAGELGMSYMGVKEACTGLQKSGFLETWRRPSSGGRPQLEYRLTERAGQLFPAESPGIVLELLESARTLFGSAAPEKLLLVVFKRMAERYGRRLPAGTLEERARRLAEIRHAEGHLSGWEPAAAGPLGGEGGLAGRIVEAHSPILEVLRAHPIAARLETEMLGELLGARVVRKEEADSGVYRCFFNVHSR